ncbi:MAG: FAD-dependent oxidoreductase [Candidatus Woesearchaeota archaeon]|jgi:thioredoxin reductase (NADPH)|nr:FAD-dependent oxidoreductase [Candidatus Woesearchaeota archaeon]MDP7181670.1 FAD-dependent oxidoreductase [Candidatus Woesearchaeota archaeon]MDP7198759.1 FAD-dependent oxidoreductase [Candidatus Woesearchaeota archaeon]MDP7467241.1 FAD-dependent oxidoreductase [Candidatus Woesearchaeota archaeon]MDP7647424.1 FAD-dependent oxidoreductase [Candidatus Woesearchaeota archaeon]
MYDIIIVGGGCAGYAAAMYAGRLNMKTLLLEGQRGGVLAVAGAVENYPGYINIDGFELVEEMRKHALEYDIDLKGEFAKDIKKKGKNFVVTGSKSYEGKTVLFSTGSEWRKLGVEGEEKFAAKGVHYCALCDGPLYKGKTVAVVGGSDSAGKDALVLSEHAKHVFMIYRREKIRPEPINLARVEEKVKKGKITIINNTNVKEIKGKDMLTSVVLDKTFKGKNDLELDGLFIAIGHIPLSDLAVKVGVKVNKGKEIIINRKAETNVAGVFAAGDVADTHFKQAITGVAEAVLAAYGAYEYVSKQEVIAT